MVKILDNYNSTENHPINHSTLSYQLAISHVSCASCVKSIEKALQALPEVKEAQMNFATRKVRVATVSTISPEKLISTLQQAGYKATLIQEAAPEKNLQKQLAKQHFRTLIIKTIIAAVLGIPLFIITMLNLLPTLNNPTGYWITLLLGLATLTVLIYSGGHFFSGAWQAFRNHQANMDTLIAVSTGSAWLYSMIVTLFHHHFPIATQHVYFEAAVIIIALVNLGAVLELCARQHTSQAIEKLIRLQPKTACLLRNNEEINVPIESLQVNDLIRVRPGEQIPVDGIVIEGGSNVDEAMITGESLAVQKQIGDKVIGGTLNKNGSFIFKALHVGKETALAQIINFVQQAQNSKPTSAKLADKIAAVFVPAVLIIAIFTALIWFNVGKEPRAIYMLITAMAVLVIACPCALGLAVPISVMVGIGKAAEYGIFIRHADALQQAQQLTTIVFDKTGTITQGHPTVIDIYPTANSDAEQLLTLAASLEIHSEHPLAEAITQAAKDQQYTLLPVNDFYAISGYGVSGIINNKRFRLGNNKLMQQRHLNSASFSAQNEKFAKQGKTSIYLADEQQLLGVITVAAPIKAEAKIAIQQLKKLGIKSIILTGDQHATARAISAQIGIDEIIANVSPAEKAGKITELQARGEKVGMVGDGINDAPALALANVGFAIGAGTDIAIESAAITLLGNSLQGIVDAITISRQTVRNMKQNLLGAFIYNIIGIPIAAGILFPFSGILLNPMIASMAMALSSFIVISNANRLRFLKPARQIK